MHLGGCTLWFELQVLPSMSSQALGVFHGRVWAAMQCPLSHQFLHSHGKIHHLVI